MKIIDYELKGNVVRFYLGKSTLTNYYGDDWDDAPYDSNAGCVYSEYIAGTADIAFPFDALVLEPCTGEFNCSHTKDHRCLCSASGIGDAQILRRGGLRSLCERYARKG